MNKPTKNKQKLYWRIIAGLAIVLIILTFTPLVLTPHKITPRLFSMPYTLWASILATIILVGLTYLGGRIYLKDDENQ